MSINHFDFTSLRFGNVALSPATERLLRDMNLSLLEMLRDLPEPLRGPAVLLLQKEYTGFSLVGGLTNFFGNIFYPPAFTILEHLQRRVPSPGAGLYAAAIRTQSAAMFLHMFDDHLVDAQLPLSHLALQIRTRIYAGFEAGRAELTRASEGPEAGLLAQGLIDDYFRAVHEPADPPLTLDEYCARFHDEMATWLVAPLLTALLGAKETSEAEHLTRSVGQAYRSFGVAWRILDDLRDWREDFQTGKVTAVSLALPEAERGLWNARETGEDVPLEALWRRSVFVRLFQRIRRELEQATNLAEAAELPAAADEYRALGAPILAAEKEIEKATLH